MKNNKSIKFSGTFLVIAIISFLGYYYFYYSISHSNSVIDQKDLTYLLISVILAFISLLSLVLLFYYYNEKRDTKILLNSIIEWMTRITLNTILFVSLFFFLISFALFDSGEKISLDSGWGLYFIVFAGLYSYLIKIIYKEESDLIKERISLSLFNSFILVMIFSIISIGISNTNYSYETPNIFTYASYSLGIFFTLFFFNSITTFIIEGIYEKLKSIKNT